jgi:hypothetical protein
VTPASRIKKGKPGELLVMGCGWWMERDAGLAEKSIAKELFALCSLTKSSGKMIKKLTTEALALHFRKIGVSPMVLKPCLYYIFDTRSPFPPP